MAKNMKRVAVLTELLLRLNGKCSRNTNTCPAVIYTELFLHFTWTDCNTLTSQRWNGQTCNKLFSFLNPKFNKNNPLSNNHTPCPCTYLTYDIIAARIYELIEEYSKG